jgi:hypothetical protein
MPIYCNSILLLKIEEQDCNETLLENMILTDRTMQRPIFSKQRVYKLIPIRHIFLWSEEHGRFLNSKLATFQAITICNLEGIWSEGI